NVLLLHHGVIPNTQFTWSLRIAHQWSSQQLCWLPKTSVIGELDGINDIFIVGDGAEIIGAQAAAAHGQALGLELACRNGSISQTDRDNQQAPFLRTLNKAKQF